MTMVPNPRNPASAYPRRRAQVARYVAMVFLASGWTTLPLSAQPPKVHYRFDGTEPPGAIGSERLQRGGPLPGYFQPVEIRAPKGARISLAVNGDFGEPQAGPVQVGLLIAPVYRLRVSNISQYEGLEVYPTIEVIDRLYPPDGERRRFPIPIELTEEDLQLALDGKFVTRVVYLEDPNLALPVAERPDDQDWFDVGPGVNPLEEADHWGRPMAIVRMGGRVPDLEEGPDDGFLHGSPPFTRFRPRMPAQGVPKGLESSGAARPRRGAAGGRTIR
ncbi:MAG TPA: hypothetical protein VMV69_09975 [Pirellulales bacterium]|nr:hypothetical protein [Pirellulales bacterium]